MRIQEEKNQWKNTLQDDSTPLQMQPINTEPAFPCTLKEWPSIVLAYIDVEKLLEARSHAWYNALVLKMLTVSLLNFNFLNDAESV